MGMLFQLGLSVSLLAGRIAGRFFILHLVGFNALVYYIRPSYLNYKLITLTRISAAGGRTLKIKIT
jgi:hypothetical protein